MASCKECLHYDVCEARIAADENYSERNYTENNNCSNFKDRNRFVELPCKVGDTVYYLQQQYSNKWSIIPVTVSEFQIDRWQRIYCVEERQNTQMFYFDDIGKTVFLTREEAEKALEGHKNNV